MSLSQVLDAVRDSNQETGGRVVEFSGTEAIVRSQGLVSSVEEIENAVVTYPLKSRAPVLVKQVAQVSIGPEMRRGVCSPLFRWC